jgi:hypothetical protein
VVEQLLSLLKALGSIPTTVERERETLRATNEDFLQGVDLYL